MTLISNKELAVTRNQLGCCLERCRCSASAKRIDNQARRIIVEEIFLNSLFASILLLMPALIGKQIFLLKYYASIKEIDEKTVDMGQGRKSTYMQCIPCRLGKALAISLQLLAFAELGFTNAWLDTMRTVELTPNGKANRMDREA